jgi:CDGSH-type Zn-finger protein
MEDRRVVVTHNGPYRVEGGVPLIRTAVVETARGEPIAWDVGPSFVTAETYELCRCGHSSTKPFCDSTHERIGFEGEETADRGPILQRRQTSEHAGIVLYDDLSLCAKHGFCRNVRTGVWEMLEEADDPNVRNEMIAMVHRCPSGRLVVARAPEQRPIEPELKLSIGVEPSGSLWIRGGIPVVSEDGSPYEVRNRQTLCRCGGSSNKPFCDGTHRNNGFADPAEPG